MKKIIYSLILAVVGSIASYLLGVDFMPHEKKCPPSQQENSLIRIDLADNDEDEYNEQLAKLRSKTNQETKGS